MQYRARVIEVAPKVTRSKGSNTRQVTDILPQSDATHSLLGGEVSTPAGNTLSYPALK